MDAGEFEWIYLEKDKMNTTKITLRLQAAETYDYTTGTNKRVLLAEDNRINQMVAVALLKMMGLAVDVVADGSEAVKALEQTPYDLVLMDCHMPVMDGYEATRTIRDPNSKVLNHAVPIVAMTANAMQGDREKCLAAGMDDYTTKPVSMEDLQKALARITLKQKTEIAVPKEMKERDGASVLCNRDELLERFEGDEKFINEIISLSLKDLPLRLAELSRFMGQQEYTSARLEAHTIKGIAANISAASTDSSAAALENDLATGTPANAERLLAELGARISELLVKLG